MKSLETLCVDYILDNLDSFCALHKSAKSEELKARFDLLQRLYSEVLIEKSRDKLRFKDEHVPLLINRHVKNLDMHDFSGCSWKTVKKSLFKYGDNLNQLILIKYFCGCSYRRRLQDEIDKRYKYTIYPWRDRPIVIPDMSNEYRRFCESPAFPDYFNVHGSSTCVVHSCCSKNEIPIHSLKSTVKRLENIQILNLSSAYLREDILEVIGKYCAHLRSLDLTYCHSVTDGRLKYLFRTSRKAVIPRCSLQNLNLSHTAVTDAGIEFMLKHMQSLETLTHERTALVLYELHKANVGKNAPERQEVLNLSELHIDMEIFEYNVFLACVDLCPRLKRLDISHNKYNCWSTICGEMTPTATMTSPDMIARQCCKFDNLTSLKLLGNNEISVDSILEQKGEKLLDLNFLHLKVSLSDIARTCPHLETLSLFKVTFLYSDKRDFAPMDNLKTFSLYCAKFSDDPTTRSITAFLSKACPNLEILRLVWCHAICPEIEESVLNCSARLNELDLRYSEFKAPLLKAVIRSSPKLKVLDIRDCQNPCSWIDDVIETLNSEGSSVKLFWGFRHGDDCYRYYYPGTHSYV